LTAFADISEARASSRSADELIEHHVKGIAVNLTTRVPLAQNLDRRRN